MNRVKIILEPRGEDGVSRREATNSPLEQGTAETIKYYVDFTDWGASDALPCSSPVVTVLGKYDADETATIFSADDATVVANVEVEFTLSALSEFKWYTVYVKATINSLVGECYFQLKGTK